mgnify:CR=1 FL=1
MWLEAAILSSSCLQGDKIHIFYSYYPFLCVLFMVLKIFRTKIKPQIKEKLFNNYN